MTKLLVIGLGGFLGAIARYGLSSWAQRWATGFPLGTWSVNVLGCFLVGLLVALGETRLALSPNVRFFLIVGFIGSFTTFATVEIETFTLVRRGDVWMAIGSVAANLVAGFGAVAFGWWLGRSG